MGSMSSARIRKHIEGSSETGIGAVDVVMIILKASYRRASNSIMTKSFHLTDKYANETSFK